MKSLVFRIRKRYLRAIMKGDKDVELRRDSKFWRTRVSNLLELRGMFSSVGFGWIPVEAIGVFFSGNIVHRRKIIAISRMKTPRDLSDQGREDVDTKMCFAFLLGEEIHEF